MPWPPLKKVLKFVIFKGMTPVPTRISNLRKAGFLLLVMGLFASCVPYSSKYYDIGQIKTPYGEMLFWLYEDTPKHKKSFLSLAT